MTTCRSEYVSKNCECLSDPMDPYDFICGYINNQNGLVYPCDPGCCGGKCNKTVSGVRFKIDPSKFSENLPPNFNVNLPQSDSASSVGAPFPPPVPPPPPKLWKVTVVPIVILFLMILLILLR